MEMVIYYYDISLLKSSAPTLTYSSKFKVKVGSLVEVPLKSKVKIGVVVKECNRPEEFEALEIREVLNSAYTEMQIKVAKFISTYYFSSIGEALAIQRPLIDFPTEPVKFDIEDRPKLSEAQYEAFKLLMEKDLALLFGVTGSGKTEIFISLIVETLKRGMRTIFLIPEISLTPQMESRLKNYFGDRVAVWHSKLKRAKRERILERIYRGEIYIVAGARSALFIPLKNVGLIIVDEEHDDSYKSMSRPRYHARDMAIYMGNLIGAKVILSSATPTVTSYYKYDSVILKEPYVKTDKRYIFLKGNSITEPIIDMVEKNFLRGEQSLIFIPTRGNFKYLYCKNCGETHKCLNCSVGMSLHTRFKYLKCHYCNRTQAIQDICMDCGHYPLTTKRLGTAEAKEIIESRVDGVVVEQFDGDTITTDRKLRNALKRFENGESHILLGTQMLSKGHDYANITLSVILGLDHLLGISDYRAREKAMSLLVQIAGRSGRVKSSNIVVQTINGDFFKLYVDNYEEFLKDEIEFLKELYPPFRTLARVLIASRSDKRALELTEMSVSKLKRFKDIEIVGYGKAPIERIANRYRYQILLRSIERVPLIKALHKINNPHIEIDIDPVEFN